MWFQDEARLGQRGTVSRVWAEKGSRPRLLRQQQYEYAYVLGAICPSSGKAIGLVMPHINTTAMRQHLTEISHTIPTGRHAVIVMDRAPWHTSVKLLLPHNISILPLPPTSPELNPVEQVWSWLRQRYWSNRAFSDYDAIVDAACDAWNIFAGRPDVVTSIGSRTWINLGC